MKLSINYDFVFVLFCSFKDIIYGVEFKNKKYLRRVFYDQSKFLWSILICPANIIPNVSLVRTANDMCYISNSNPWSSSV